MPAIQRDPLNMVGSSPGRLVWSDALLLGYGPMDASHRDFVDCVHAIQDASDAALPAALAAFARHAETHFGEEDAWMRTTAFPAAQCHIDEHAAVLRSLSEVRTALEAGAHASVARSLAKALGDWFPGHADYMDAALAHWMVRRRHGGTPVVLRRTPLPSSRPPHASER